MEAVKHSRAEYERQLYLMRVDIRSLGELSIQAVERSIRALRQRNIELAEQVIREDRRINDLCLTLEERALLLIARQQPLATDLRIVAAAMFIVGELERIGDYAAGAARLVILAGENAPVKPLVDIPRMAELTTSMLNSALDAFVDLDIDASQRIRTQDDEVDALNSRIRGELLAIMREDPDTVDQATQLLWIAHNLERIGDRVANICERTAFVVTGNPRALMV